VYSSDTHPRYFDLKVLAIIFIMLLTIFFATSAQAQEESKKHKYISIGISGLTGTSLGDFFYESNQITTWGINGTLLYHPKKPDKLLIGFGISYFNYGLEKYRREIQIEGNYYEVETLRNYNIYFPYINTRLMPWDNLRFVPVFDAFLGPRAFSTVSTYSIDEETGFLIRLFGKGSDGEIVKHTEHKDWTWGYGFSVGVNYYASNFIEFELTLSYTDGGEVHYLTKSDIIRDPVSGSFSYKTRKSDTDMLVLGIGMRLNPL